ncbi:hypothetical protein PAPYR_1806 [Paratrimastix pyriformis]|uniref:Uncharacterized protein n=1 Tax=Paratrimastix pyriformis TaxID=342808 RepID=A0ABQ8URB7_9EUKA|nr:hypothetical protein PAPYR_1806 [Paratrimastix pyriformis]
MFKSTVFLNESDGEEEGVLVEPLDSRPPPRPEHISLEDLAVAKQTDLPQPQPAASPQVQAALEQAIGEPCPTFLGSDDPAPSSRHPDEPPTEDGIAPGAGAASPAVSPAQDPAKGGRRKGFLGLF